MGDFIFNLVLWTFALYGVWELVKTIMNIYTCTNLKADGIYFVIAAKNAENKIEGFVRSLLFKVIYGKEENIKQIMITDLDSTDGTARILENLSKDYDCVKLVKWKECKEVIESIKDTL